MRHRLGGAPAGWSQQSFGDHGEGETPGSIPNPEVKPFSADGTARGSVWESRTSPDILSLRAACQGGPQFFYRYRHSLVTGAFADAGGVGSQERSCPHRHQAECPAVTSPVVGPLGGRRVGEPGRRGADPGRLGADPAAVGRPQERTAPKVARRRAHRRHKMRAVNAPAAAGARRADGDETSSPRRPAQPFRPSTTGHRSPRTSPGTRSTGS